MTDSICLMLVIFCSVSSFFLLNLLGISFNNVRTSVLKLSWHNIRMSEIWTQDFCVYRDRKEWSPSLYLIKKWKCFYFSTRKWKYFIYVEEISQSSTADLFDQIASLIYFTQLCLQFSSKKDSGTVAFLELNKIYSCVLLSFSSTLALEHFTFFILRVGKS